MVFYPRAPSLQQTLTIAHSLAIIIKLDGEIPDVDLQLKVSADIKEVKFEVQRNAENIIRSVFNQKM